MVHARCRLCRWMKLGLGEARAFRPEAVRAGESKLHSHNEGVCDTRCEALPQRKEHDGWTYLSHWRHCIGSEFLDHFGPFLEVWCENDGVFT